MRSTMRSTTTAAAGVLAFLAATAFAPAAAASTKYEFEDAAFDGVTGTIYAAVNDHNKKPDHVHCGYRSPDHEFLGYYNAEVDGAPTSPASVLAFCQAHFEDRTQ